MHVICIYGCIQGDRPGEVTPGATTSSPPIVWVYPVLKELVYQWVHMRFFVIMRLFVFLFICLAGLFFLIRNTPGPVFHQETIKIPSLIGASSECIFAEKKKRQNAWQNKTRKVSIKNHHKPSSHKFSLQSLSISDFPPLSWSQHVPAWTSIASTTQQLAFIVSLHYQTFIDLQDGVHLVHFCSPEIRLPKPEFG